jgi:glucokinase
MSRAVIGLDIGGTKLAAALFDAAGEITAREQAPSPSMSGPDAMVTAAAALVGRLSARAARDGLQPPAALGVATAGVVDARDGSILSAVGTIKGWAGVPLRLLLEDLTGLPVAVENDVNAMALAEGGLGAGRGCGSALVVAVGTGVGGALLIGGKLWRGRTGTAGEIGHMPVDAGADARRSPACSCGRRGHLEAFVSGPAIVSQYATAAGAGRTLTLQDVSRAHDNGDQAAAEAIRQAGTVLGRSLGGLVNAVDPDLVILAGGVLALGVPFTGPLETAFRAELLPGPEAGVHVVQSQFGADAGVIGAGQAALGRLTTAEGRASR